MHLFYTPDITKNFYTLNEIESKHCNKVLRLKPNDIIYLTDGKGNLHKSKIIENELKKCKVEIIEILKEYNKRPYKLHIAIAPTKNIDRFEWFLEKATEIGVDEITPIICQHSERKTVKIERMHRIIQSAMKQSIKAYLPKINDITDYESVLKSSINYKYIAHCQNNTLPHLKTVYFKENDAFILIGPEGDFSPYEVQLANNNNFTEISLGKNRLRTETAGVVSCQIINLLND
ncbi:16S rRNA (uracil(1498)-N(3))-methyltransferase [Bacteroidota bacterium]